MLQALCKLDIEHPDLGLMVGRSDFRKPRYPDRLTDAGKSDRPSLRDVQTEGELIMRKFNWNDRLSLLKERGWASSTFAKGNQVLTLDIHTVLKSHP